ncbi:MAG: flagellar motor protein MotB, partial [Chitinophagaceae bacterium]|nr:flagellar motor protein MotB [Chitinophagaceae bacterium]
MSRRIRNIIFFIFLTPFIILSQKNKGGSILANGNMQYEQNNYQYAIVLYEKYIKEFNSTDTVAIQKLANCYRLVKAYENALMWYKRAYALQPANEEVAYRYAESSATALNYDNAISILERLVTKNPGNKTYQKKLDGYRSLNNYSKNLSLLYNIRYLSINTDFDEYSPQIKGNRLVFVSNRPRVSAAKPSSGSPFAFLSKKQQSSQRESGWTALPFYNFFESPDTAQLSEVAPFIRYGKTFKDSKIVTGVSVRSSNDNDILQKDISNTSYIGVNETSSQILDMNLKVKLNAGPLSFTEDGKKVFYTRNKLKKYNNSFGLEIVEAVLNNNKWEARRVFPNNSTPDSWFHPALSSNGRRLYFSSNMPGGFGGNDLYFVDISDNSMSLPINLGPEVNTPGNDEFPTIKGDTLFFSSDGHAGFGAMDIFKSVKSSEGWATPVNMGYPINSSFDDFGISFNPDGKSGYFSSNRFSSDDIYAFSQIKKNTNARTSETTQQNMLLADDYFKSLYERAKGIINAPGVLNTQTANNENSGLTTKAESIVTNSSAKNSLLPKFLFGNRKNEKQSTDNNITIEAAKQPGTKDSLALQSLYKPVSIDSAVSGLAVRTEKKTPDTAFSQGTSVPSQSAIPETEKNKVPANAGSAAKNDFSNSRSDGTNNSITANTEKRKEVFAPEELNNKPVNKPAEKNNIVPATKKPELVLKSGEQKKEADGFISAKTNIDSTKTEETIKNGSTAPVTTTLPINNKTAQLNQKINSPGQKGSDKFFTEKSAFNLLPKPGKKNSVSSSDITKTDNSKTKDAKNRNAILQPEALYKKDSAADLTQKENGSSVNEGIGLLHDTSSARNIPPQTALLSENYTVVDRSKPLEVATKQKEESLNVKLETGNNSLKSESPGKISEPVKKSKKEKNVLAIQINSDSSATKEVLT